MNYYAKNYKQVQEIINPKGITNVLDNLVPEKIKNRTKKIKIDYKTDIYNYIRKVVKR